MNQLNFRKTNNFKFNWLTTGLLLLTLVFMACNQSTGEAVNSSEAVIETHHATWDEYMNSLAADEIGRYKIIASNGVEDSDGFRLQIEERFYVELEKSRFVVEQSDLILKAQYSPIESLQFSVRQGQEVISFFELDTELSSQSLTTQLYATDLHNVENIMSSHQCGFVEVMFVNESLFPIQLSTCNRPSPG